MMYRMICFITSCEKARLEVGRELDREDGREESLSNKRSSKSSFINSESICDSSMSESTSSLLPLHFSLNKLHNQNTKQNKTLVCIK